uniref:Uncharacterized protein n=1 Tax=Tanacetum cinerariifolium TaxID=118510 RepID=A0A699GWH4_TANCI|nr:hypothetical protein [Tanacetum cinerariifolium]
MHVLDQNKDKEVKDSELHSLGDVTFEQLMDEVDQQNKDAQEKAESPYDTKSKIKFIKSFKVATIFDLLSIHQEEEEHTANVENITCLGSGLIGMELNDSDSDYRIHFMHDNDLVSLTCFEAPNFADEESQSDHQGTADNLHITLGVKKSLVVDTSEKEVSDNEPLVKKLKFLILTSSLITSPTPLNSILPKPVLKTEVTTMTFYQFTKHLTQTTSTILSPFPLREPTPPREESKGKGIITKEPLKEIMPFMNKGGSFPKMLSLKSFVTPEGKLTNEYAMAQVKEMKRLADLKAEKEKSEASLKKIMNPADI